ncbi:LysR substrate-binding domain-containing protein [Ideonella sp.]|uniref:LysR substrate-binding domain-containing protein n=1 Tax=Ideonella sp. TaxID=1929293 RepID=UPI003BB4D6B6
MAPDLRQLQGLLAIARHGTLARAADELNCSPSALSMQLSQLQSRLGMVLLRRTGRGLSLTADGELLLPAAREAAAAVARLTDLASGKARQTGDAPAAMLPPTPVTIGTILDPAAIRLGEFLRAVRQQAPQIHPELRHGISGGVLKDVRSGRLDLGFCLGQPDPGRLRVLRLASVRYVVVAPRGWQARLQGCSWEDLATMPWIATPSESVHHQLLAPLFGRLARPVHTVARVDQEASMLDLVRAGFGLSLAREAVALREADQSGLALSRQHSLDTALWLVAPRPEADDTRATTVDSLFEVAAQVWQTRSR